MQRELGFAFRMKPRGPGGAPAHGGHARSAAAARLAAKRRRCDSNPEGALQECSSGEENEAGGSGEGGREEAAATGAAALIAEFIALFEENQRRPGQGLPSPEFLIITTPQNNKVPLRYQTARMNVHPF